MVRQREVEDEENENSPLRFDRRSRNNFKDWAVIITLAVNLSGLVWAAAKWSSAIESLQGSSTGLIANQEVMKNKISTLESRIILLEYQVNAVKNARP